ncbi:hypothetical protein BH09PLA1_BH09PLA1_32360 [soil metagenome]
MMRKDVKLGFAIGGVLLAVLVVYVLVGTGNGDQNRGGATIVTEDPASAKIAPDKTASANPPKLPDTSALNNTAGIVGSSTAQDSSRAPLNAPANAVATNDQVSKPNESDHDLWNSALNEGQLLISKTPDAPSNVPGGNIPGGNIPGGAIANDPRMSTPSNGGEINGTTSNSGASTSRGDAVLPASASDTSAITAGDNSLGGPSTRPSDELRMSTSGTSASEMRSSGLAAAGQREHIVQPGETLSLIAQAAYGNASLYPAILRANPNLDPKRMRAGTTIILPAVSDVRPDVKPSGAASANDSTHGANATGAGTEVNSRTEYRVQSNDSLYRIAMKLYGKPEMVAKIYELNKEAIGSDPAKLKLNMILKLPEPPAQSASR